MGSQTQPASGPREIALSDGFDAIGDADLVAVVLGTGTFGRPAPCVASDLLASLGGLGGLARSGPHAVASHPGVGLAKACRLAAGIELGRRFVARACAAPGPLVAASDQVAAWARPRLGPLDHEELWVLALDGRNRLRAARRVAEGGLHGCSVSVRDVVRVALREAASAFVVVHNHPSGDPTPSGDDVDLTRAIAAAGDVVATPLVDHVIVGGDGHASLFDLGLVGPRRR